MCLVRFFIISEHLPVSPSAKFLYTSTTSAKEVVEDDDDEEIFRLRPNETKISEEIIRKQNEMYFNVSTQLSLEWK